MNQVYRTVACRDQDKAAIRSLFEKARARPGRRLRPLLRPPGPVAGKQGQGIKGNPGAQAFLAWTCNH
jgi:hypothetical protein